LCDIYKIRKSDRHTASGDAFITALLFLKLKKKLEI
jgi:DNA polymerase-3 subunit epsilon